jgi:hypothetical protein
MHIFNFYDFIVKLSSNGNRVMGRVWYLLYMLIYIIIFKKNILN